MAKIFFRWCGVLMAVKLAGCAVLHHVQLGQIDNRTNVAQVPFEIKVSETGVNTQEISALSRAAKNEVGNTARNAADIVSMFQIGPRTGDPIYDEHYAEKVLYLIHEKCPSGRVTGLVSIRETRKYPVISGEIVKITGYCMKDRKPAAEI
ncbi:MAG: hypothetical protein C5B49_05240 [Bdellovibrio sp.]|nr:MAG: hypothetical protein C5B49_05240 [Bdellovibrio sp.]